jgi:hypothetical protein
VSKGSISGTVADEQGAVIGSAQVKATNTATGAVLSATTDSAGAFRFNLIPIGNYNVEVSATGFKTQAQSNVSVTASQDTGLGVIKLSVGSASTTVEVTSETPLIESTQAQVTNTFSTETLETFAGVQDNEGLDNLALFVPGVGSSRDNNFSNTNGGIGFSVNGLRGRNNDQQIDGQNNNDNSVAGPSLFLSDPEWVSQYIIVSNNFGPEYGRNSGSVVNLLTKGGGNAWHGSVYGSYNNSVFNSMTNFQKNFNVDAKGNRLTSPPALNDTFSGIQVGGPVVKNRVFVAGGFNNEIINQSSPFTSGGVSPTPNGLATLATCPGVNPQALSALKQFGAYGVTGGNPVPSNATIPMAGQPNFIPGCPGVEFGNVTRVLNQNFRAYNFYGRTDVQWTHDTLSGRYIYSKLTPFNTSQFTDGPASGYPANVPSLSQTALVSWTHNFNPRMVNEARVSYGRANVEFGGNTIGNTIPNAGQLSNALAQVTFDSPAQLGFGPLSGLPQQRIVNTWQIQDNWNYSLGRHTVKAGVNWTYQRTPNTFLPNINGLYRFSSWSNYFANTPDLVNIANGSPSLDYREYDTFGYIGDDWKIRKDFTLNLGLTYTYYGQPANLFNDLTTTRESNPATAFWNPAVPLAARTNPRIPTPTNSFGPSAGFAYAPQWGGIFGHGKTVFRGGYRYLYDPPFYNIYTNISTSAPMVFLQSFRGASAQAQPLPAVPTGPNVRTQLSPFLQKGVFDPRTFNQTNVSPNFGPDKVHSWSFGIQREITKNSAVEVRYVGNKANNLFQTVDGNPFIADLQASFPQFVPAGLTPCTASAQVLAPGQTTPTDLGRANCGQGVVRTRTNGGFSNYQAVQTEFRANNLWKQTTLRVAYTYSKTLDNVSEIFNSLGGGNTIAVPQNPVSPQHGEYSFSGLDYPHTFSFLVVEQLPMFKDQHGFLGHAFGGWAISANYLLQSGQRYTPSQFSGIASATAAGDFFDSKFLAAFNGGFDSARPFLGSSSAPITNVGIFLGDACDFFSVCTDAGGNLVTSSSANRRQLVSLNSINTTGNTVNVTSNQVRYIVNGGTAESIFGTPFGNSPRNIPQTDMTNIANLSVSKRMKLSERTSFEFRASALNVLNHPNFLSVDPFLEDAGLFASGTGFGNPKVTDTVPGVIFGSNAATASRKLVFGGTIRF